jgi:hypothetical protein
MKLIECFDPVTFEFLNEKGYLKINDKTNECYLSLNLFYDKRHSWLEVPLLLLAMMKCPPENFTKYCRINKAKSAIYLDEDVDVGVFYEALMEWPTSDHIKRLKEVYNDCADELVEYFDQHTVENGSLFESIHVKPKYCGEESDILQLKTNDRGSSIH